jgi:hypothetical protein
MGGTAWFWNRASARSRRMVAIVSLAGSCFWLGLDVLRPPLTWSVAVPLFLIVFFGVQWRAAARALREDTGNSPEPSA